MIKIEWLNIKNAISYSADIVRSYHITMDTQKKKSHSVVAHSFFDGFTSEAEEKVMIRPAKMRHWPFSKLTIATTANCSTPTPRLIGTTTPTWPTRTPPLSWVSGRGSFLTLESWLDFFCYWKKKRKNFIFVSRSEFVWFLENWQAENRLCHNVTLSRIPTFE